MKQPLLAVAFAVTACASWHNPEIAQPPRTTPACMPVDDYATQEVAALKQIMASTNPIIVTFRIDAAIPVVADSAIEIVSNDATCVKALTTLNRLMDRRIARATSLYVIRLGTRFTAARLDSSGNEYTNWLLMDHSFAAIGGYLR